jgi:hypothetical protein
MELELAATIAQLTQRRSEEIKKKNGGNSGGGLEMDPNLTYPVILNASINATLSPAPSNVIKDWLPSIISIIVVIMAGLTTYFFTARIEERKREYELKKETYIGYLEILCDINLFFRTDSTETESKDKLNKLKREIEIILLKFSICNASLQVKELTGKLQNNLVPRLTSKVIKSKEIQINQEIEYLTLEIALVQAMKEDLYSKAKSRWPFRK